MRATAIRVPMTWALGSPILGRSKPSRTAPTPNAITKNTNQTPNADK